MSEHVLSFHGRAAVVRFSRQPMTDGEKEVILRDTSHVGLKLAAEPMTRGELEKALLLR